MAILRRSLALGSLALATVAGLRDARGAIASTSFIKGEDFSPLYHAGLAVVHGSSIYADHNFVYPPTAAVAMVPLSLGSYPSDLKAWLILSTIAVAAAGLVSLAPWRGGWWPLAGGLAAFALLKSDVFTGTLEFGNMSQLLAPAAVGVLALYEARCWRLGTALLILTLLLKPLLLPLILLPALRGEWRALTLPLLAGCVLFVIALVLVPGAGDFAIVLHYLTDAGPLVGSFAVYNLSIHGLASSLHVTVLGWVARVLVTLLTIAAAYVWVRRPLAPGAVAAIGTLLLVAAMLVGPLSEEHYLLVAAPCLLLALALSGGWIAAAAALPGVILLFYWEGAPFATAQGSQIRFVLLELLLWAAAALAARLVHEDSGPPLNAAREPAAELA